MSFWFTEKHEKLRVLHEKFKEEVNKQLLDCRDSLKDFESYHAELKEVADKQSKFKTTLNIHSNAIEPFT